MLLMLEDNADRIDRFQAALARIEFAPPLLLWRSAWTMLAEMPALLPATWFISLDHDLDPIEGDTTDPGTGWDVTKVLAGLQPVCPVIIHTSNSERATWMMGEFELGGWKYHRLPPLGDDWIEDDWYRLVRRLLRKRCSQTDAPNPTERIP